MKTKENNKCVHCGADCVKNPIIWNDQKFCCNGCKTVFEMLHENKLYTYYKLEDTPGIKLETSEFGNKYAFLDNPEVANKLIIFNEGEISKVKFYIPVIHCASCIWLLEHIDKLHKGIKYSAVNFVRKEVEITFNCNQISLRQLVELLGSIHYVPDLSQSQPGQTEEVHSYKKLLYKIGVAGFVFTNVMTYSLPHYFHGKPMEDKLSNVLGILSYILIFPVVFYSGSDYYISAFKNLRKRSASIDLPIALGIIVLFLVTSYDVLTGTGPGYSDSLAGLVFFLLVGKWYQGKSYEALSFERNYKSYFPIAITKLNRQLEEKTMLEKEVSILLENIAPGDIILIRNRELIPADSVLVEGNGLIDYSFVTGESSPAVKKEGDFLYAGGRQMGNIIKIKVEKNVDQSHLTHLWNIDRTYTKPTDSLKNLTDHISKYFTIVVIAIATAGFAGWMLIGDLHTAVFVFTAVLIIACPCALALSVPFTFGNTMRIFGSKGLYIKNTSVIEKLSLINTIVFDKTGTLTKTSENQIEYFGKELSEPEKAAVHSLAKQSPHPLSMTLANYFGNYSYIAPSHFVEVEGRGVFGKVENMMIKYGSEEYVANRKGSSINNSTTVFLIINEIEYGHFRISNQYRQGLDDVIRGLKRKFELYLITGDNDSEKENLARYFDEENMFFNQKPQEKAAIIERLQKTGKITLMTGDGLNDAGALMQSDVALSIANKAYQFSPASDAVLEAEKFVMLSKFINFTHTARKIVWASFIISLIYNVIGISIALAGLMSPVIAAILMPASSVSVVAFATIVTRVMGKIKFKNARTSSLP